MKLSNEAKIGIIGIVTLAVLVWGINYLKGRNILASTYTLKAYYSETNGLETSAPVLLNGVKIGFVHDILLHPKNNPPVEILISIEKSYPITEGSRAVLFSADLLGTKAILIELAGTDRYLEDGASISSSIKPDMLTSLQSQMIPVMNQIGTLTHSLDSLAKKLEALIVAESTTETMQHLSSISRSIKSSLEPGGSLNQSIRNLESFTDMLKNQESEIASFTSHLNSISEAVDSADILVLTQNLSSVSHQFNLLMEKINSGEGTAGKLVHEETLYYHLDSLAMDLDALIRDLTKNPQNYIHFSLFGKSGGEK